MCNTVSDLKCNISLLPFDRQNIFIIVKMKYTNVMATKQLHCQNRKLMFFSILLLWEIASSGVLLLSDHGKC